MSHKRTKSENERFSAALAALDVEQNCSSSNTTQQPVSSSAAAVAGNIEGARSQAHTESTGASHGMSSQAMIRSQFKQNARLASINSINESSSISAATEVEELNSTQNPDFPTLSGERIAKMMHRKQQNLQGESKASTATTEWLTNPIQGFRGANELGLTRVQTLKQRDEYIAVTARHAVRNDYARGNELGLTRVETVKQQAAYRAATLQQNDEHASYGNDCDIESGTGIIVTENIIPQSRANEEVRNIEHRSF